MKNYLTPHSRILQSGNISKTVQDRDVKLMYDL